MLLVEFQGGVVRQSALCESMSPIEEDISVYKPGPKIGGVGASFPKFRKLLISFNDMAFDQQDRRFDLAALVRCEHLRLEKRKTITGG